MGDTERVYKTDIDNYDEDTSNPFVNMVKTVLRFLWTAITFPFKFVWNFLKMMNNVRIFVLGLITLIFVTILVIILIFIFKPSFAWEPLKGFLNNDIKTPTYQDVSEAKIYQRINSGGLGEIIITESEATYLFRKAGLINENSLIGFTDNSMTVYLNGDSKESPLWIYIKTKTDHDKNLTVESSGFGRFNMPDFVSNWMASGFNSVVDLLGRQNRSSSLIIVMNQVLDSKQIVLTKVLKSAEIRQNVIILKYDITGLD